MFNKDVVNFHVKKLDFGEFNLTYEAVDGGTMEKSVGDGMGR